MKMSSKWLFILSVLNIAISFSNGTCKLYRKTINQPGLIHYWSFDQNTNDMIGNAHIYEIMNASFTVDYQGRQNSSTKFIDGYARIPCGMYCSNEYTLMVWIKPYEVISFGRIIEFSFGPPNIIFGFIYSFDVTMVPRIAYTGGKCNNKF